MLSTKSYRIDESGSRGKIVVAVRDIMPGELVLEEKDPVLFFPHSFYAQYDVQQTGMGIPIPAFSMFMKHISSEKQRTLLSLYGPTTGNSAESVRNFARKGLMFRFREDEEHRNLTAEEAEIFVKVAQVVRLNVFGSEEFGYTVFEEITRFAHSCDANCHWVFEGQSIFCYANRWVRAGEELNISYVPNRDIHQTHERRHNYLQMKEFTCHCRRCDALGDDTRQFDCIDPACKGVMMACEPMDLREIPISNASYSGVKYVAPHLLPCTVCHSTAPADYQARMFELEERLPGLVDTISARFDACLKMTGSFAFEQMLQEIASRNIPRRHAAALPLLSLECRMKHVIFQRGPLPADSVRAPLLECIIATERIFPHPHAEVSKVLNFAVDFLCDDHLPAFLSPLEEKDLCQKALRVYMLLHGRSRREHRLDEPVALALQKLPHAGLTDVCTFCEESPQRAALTLSRCGRCKQVVYCSAGCQKAHWPQHKKSCQAPLKK